MGKAIFRKINGRIIPIINGKRVQLYQARANAVKKVREFIKKKTELSRIGKIPEHNMTGGGIDVHFGSRVGDKFVKQFKGYKSDQDIIERAGKDLYLENNGIGPKTMYVKTKYNKYSVQDNITSAKDSLFNAYDKYQKRKMKGYKKISKARIDKRWESNFWGNAEKISRKAKINDNVELRDLAPANAGWKNKKLQIFDSGNIVFKGKDGNWNSGYKSLLKLAKKAKKNMIGKWDF